MMVAWSESWKKREIGEPMYCREWARIRVPVVCDGRQERRYRDVKSMGRNARGNGLLHTFNVWTGVRFSSNFK